MSSWAAVGSQRGCILFFRFSFRCIIYIHCFRCVNVFSRSVLTLCSCSLSPALKIVVYAVVINKCSQGNGVFNLIFNKWAAAGEKIGCTAWPLWYIILEFLGAWVFSVYCYLEDSWSEIVLEPVEGHVLDSKWSWSMVSRMSWSMVSNAVDRSRITVDVMFWFPNPYSRSFVNFSRMVSVL